MGDIQQNITGDVSGLEKELAKLQREIIRLREENAKTSKESAADSARQARELKRLGESIKRDQITPLEEYRHKLGLIRKAEKDEIITREQANRAAKEAAQAAREASPAYQKLQKAEADAARAAKEQAAQQARAREEIGRFADGVKRSLDPLIDYREKLLRLREAHRLGDLDQEEYRASVDQLKRKIRESSPAYQRLQEEIKRTQAETARHEQSVKRFADTVKREIATPLEMYKGKLQQLREAHRLGKLGPEEYRKAVDQLKASVRGVQQPLEDAAKKQNLIAGAGQRLLGIATAYASIGTAISFVNREFERKLELENKSKDTQVSVGDAQAGLRTNLGSLTGEQRRSFIDQVQGLQGETRFQDLVALNQAASAGISGGGTPEQVLDAVRQAALVSRQNPGQLETLVGAGIDISKASGIVDAKANLGFVLSAGAVSRPTDLEAQARNIPTAVIGVAGTDTSGDRQRASREGAAAFAVLSNLAADVRGESSATSSISLATQLRDFFAAEERADPKTFGGRVRALQQDADLRSEFFANANFEQRFKIPVEQLLAGGTEAAANFERAVDSITFDKARFQELATDLGFEGITSEIRLGVGQREAESIEQQTERSDALSARRALARKILTDAIKQTNDSGFAAADALTESFVFDGRQETGFHSPEQEAIRKLQARLTAEQTPVFGGEVSPKSRQDIEYLERQIAVLERIAAAVTQQGKLPNQQTTAVAVDQHR